MKLEFLHSASFNLSNIGLLFFWKFGINWKLTAALLLPKDFLKYIISILTFTIILNQGFFLNYTLENKFGEAKQLTKITTETHCEC
jgi:hypothetical protein